MSQVPPSIQKPLDDKPTTRTIMSHLHAPGASGHALRDYGLVDLSSPTRVVARHISMQRLDGELTRAYSFEPDLSFHYAAQAWLYGRLLPPWAAVLNRPLV